MRPYEHLDYKPDSPIVALRSAPPDAARSVLAVALVEGPVLEIAALQGDACVKITFSVEALEEFVVKVRRLCASTRRCPGVIPGESPVVEREPCTNTGRCHTHRWVAWGYG